MSFSSDSSAVEKVGQPLFGTHYPACQLSHVEGSDTARSQCMGLYSPRWDKLWSLGPAWSHSQIFRKNDFACWGPLGGKSLWMYQWLSFLFKSWIYLVESQYPAQNRSHLDIVNTPETISYCPFHAFRNHLPFSTQHHLWDGSASSLTFLLTNYNLLSSFSHIHHFLFRNCQDRRRTLSNCRLLMSIARNT